MIPLIVLLPVAILILAALGILIMQQVRPSIGYAWLIGSAASLAALGVLLFLRTQLPLQLVIEQWQVFSGYSSPPVFRLDTSSWPYAVCLAVLSYAFILTDSARLETEARPDNWAAGMMVLGLGLLAVMAGSPVTLIVTWTAVDLIEFLMVMSTTAGRRMGEQTVIAFSVRVTGTLIVLFAILFARSQAIPFSLAPIPSPLAVFLLLAAGLRLGVLPLNIPYTTEVYSWRGLGNVMRMVGPASSLVVLGRMPEAAVSQAWQPLFLIFSALAALYGGAMWLTAESELTGRPYWLTALAGLGIASVTNGSPMASIAWGVTLILSGSVLFFFSARRKQILFIPLLGMLGIAGLPFNPAASGWSGVAGPPLSLYSILFIVTVVLLILGYLRHALRPRDELYRMERWVHTIYPIGLMFLVGTQWIIGVYGWPGSLTAGEWWASTVTAVLVGICGILAYSFRGSLNRDVVTVRWVSVFARQAGGFLGSLFRMNWLYRLLVWLYRLMQNVIQLLTAMFEGEGGVLWSMVMLALLISLIWKGGQP